jgi:hypothetical protein
MPTRNKVFFEKATPAAEPDSTRGYTVLPATIPRMIASVTTLIPFACSHRDCATSVAPAASAAVSAIPVNLFMYAR